VVHSIKTELTEINPVEEYQKISVFLTFVCGNIPFSVFPPIDTLTSTTKTVKNEDNITEGSETRCFLRLKKEKNKKGK